MNTSKRNILKRLTIGVAAVAVTAVPLMATSSSAFAGTEPPPPAPVDCSTVVDDAWPANVQGQPPSFESGALGGAYLWHDSTGWHLRVTHKNSTEKTFRGTIHVPRGVIRFDRVLNELGDKVKLSPNGKTLTFRFTNYGHVDGIDFRTSCAPKLNFGFKVDGHKLAKDRIFIGATEWHPAHNPFRIVR